MLGAEGMAVVATREPGGSSRAEKLRDFLLQAPDDEGWSPWTEAFLIAAARREHVLQLIQPALAAGKLVICDRYSDSTIAYQGYGRGLPLLALCQLVDMAQQGIEPDLTFILDMPAETAAGRVVSRGEAATVFERQDANFQARVRQGFLDLAERNPARYHVLDATADAASLTIRMAEAIRTLVAGRRQSAQA